MYKNKRKFRQKSGKFLKAEEFKYSSFFKLF